MEQMDIGFDFIDLFAGIGGTRIAFSDAGGRCVFGSEWDPHSRRTYFANFGEMPAGDITKLQMGQIPKFDVLVAGFPCQPFSSIGLRQGFRHKTQGTLFHNIAEIITAKRPSAFLLENVAGLETHDSGRTIQIIVNVLEDLGYIVERKILDAAEFGVPQHRRRMYIVGFKRRSFGAKFPMSWPAPSSQRVGIGKFVESNVVGYSISKHLQRVYIFNEKKDNRPQVISTETTTPVKTLVASYHKIQRLTGTFVRDGETGLRLLTESECRAIMGFPRSFRIPESVSRTQMYRQYGNSVAVPVVRKIAFEMAQVLSAKKVEKLIKEAGFSLDNSVDKRKSRSKHAA